MTAQPPMSRLRSVRTRSISPENFDGSAGGGARATEGTGAACARDLGTGWKISPSVDIAPGATFTLAEIDGPGKITMPLRDDIASMSVFYLDGPATNRPPTPGADDLEIHLGAAPVPDLGAQPPRFPG